MIEHFTKLLPSGQYQIPAGYYVYMLSVDDYGPVYVGKGKGSRAWDHISAITAVFSERLAGRVSSDESAVYSSIIRLLLRKQKNLSVTIIKQNLTQEAAFALEAVLVKSIGRCITNSGPLFNLSDGGNVVTGKGYLDAKHRHSDGENFPKTRNKKRNRPNLESRQHMASAFGSFGGNDD